MKEALPAGLQRVEKASVDEVFMDLCAQVHSILLERYPELRGPPPYDDPTENLPLPPTTVLDWQADALVDLDVGETEDDEPDWDDIAILIGSEIVRDVRKAVFEKLRYTVSGGVSRNKMLAKLGSAHKKPNAQTVIRNRAVQVCFNSFVLFILVLLWKICCLFFLAQKGKVSPFSIRSSCVLLNLLVLLIYLNCLAHGFSYSCVFGLF